MLVEIRCDKFKTSNEEPNTITFHQGLNVINGGDKIYNSIGKSTLIQIIDYVFGGEDYTKSAAAKKLGEHTFFFSFKFDDDYYFKRNTKDKQVVRCNRNYEDLEIITLEKYRQWLLEKYNLAGLGETFRNLTGPFIRLSSKDINPKKDVLKVVSSEKTVNAFSRLESLFNKFNEINPLKKQEDDAKNKYDTYSNSIKYGFIDNSVTKEKQIEEKEEELQSLKDEYEMLLSEKNIEPSAKEIPIENKALIYRNKITGLRRSRTLAENRLVYVNQNLNGENFIPSTTISRLKEFFPDVDIAKIEEIEKFHSKLSENLTIEFEEEKNILSKDIRNIEKQIQQLENEVEKLGIPVSIPKSYLEEIIEKKEQIQSLETSIENFKRKNSLLDSYKELKTNRESSETEILSEIQNIINQKLKKLNLFIYGDTVKAPELEINGCNSYTYKTEGDDGDGISLKNAIIFDLAIIELTPLPILLHDTDINKEINKDAHGKIIELYNTYTNKQIFIGFDETQDYSESIRNIIEQQTIVHLSKGNELFGVNFSTK